MKVKSIKHVPEELWNRLKAQAQKEHKIFSFFVIELLTKSIDEIEKNNK